MLQAVLQRFWLALRWLTSLLLQPGGVPKHIAFIMDGNRRFAAGKHLQRIDGHRRGYSKMVDAIHWCLELGVQYITVYAFSIDNFSRSLDEVEQLMHLAETKFGELMQDDGLAERMGVEVRILGDLSLAPPSVQGSAARLMRKTAALPAKQAVLNICFSYTSREELIHSMDTLSAGLQSGALVQQDVTPQLLHRCLRTQASPPVDLLVRTSGETRLSDFLLWQCAHAQLEWVDSMWPNWTHLSFARCILKWQIHAAKQAQLRQTAVLLQHQPLPSSQHQPQHQPPSTQAEPAATLHSSQIKYRQQQHVTADDASALSNVLWKPPVNWAPHKFAPVYSVLLHHLRSVYAYWTSPATPASVPHLPAPQQQRPEGVAASRQPLTTPVRTGRRSGDTACVIASRLRLDDIDLCRNIIRAKLHTQPTDALMLESNIAALGQTGMPACVGDTPCSSRPGTPSSSSGHPVSELTSSPAESDSVMHSPCATPPGSPTAAQGASVAAAQSDTAHVFVSAEAQYTEPCSQTSAGSHTPPCQQHSHIIPEPRTGVRQTSQLERVSGLLHAQQQAQERWLQEHVLSGR